MVEVAAALYSTPRLTAIFTAEAHVRQMLAFEAALARAEARAGVIPADAAEAIAAACRVEHFDVEAIFREAAVAGTAAIPLARLLTERVEGEARRYVHWGATSQDAIDTATTLQVREALDALEEDLLGVCAACASLAERYRRSPMAARTLMQQALPITFGLKAARWLGLATRQARALRALRPQVLVVQLGGAAGTLASLGERGLAVADLLAEELGLGAPDLPWHAERDRVASLAAALGITAGGMGKIASDVVLLAQSEVGEVAEAAAPGKGGSSAMPQKRNPVDATIILAAARLALGHVPPLLSGLLVEHERSVGAWQAEWAALPDLFRTCGAAVERTRRLVEGLEVFEGRMAENLALGGGVLMSESLTMALAPLVGRPEAYRLVQSATRRVFAEGISLGAAAAADPAITAALPGDALRQALDPAAYLGSADALVERALADYARLQADATGRSTANQA